MMSQQLPIEIDVHQTKSLVDQKSCLLLDCRNQNEFDFVRIAGATFIPMNELQQRLQELEAYRDQRVVVYCHIGGRSFQVANWLRQQGFAKSQSMAGGVEAWATEIDSSLPRY